ncbi:hypothetical protein KAX17_08650 [Candidatus Bipolaricaulota bacterium]|nr:hypothetical protein [Candidatus Bipolaricaulota bacterium]
MNAEDWIREDFRARIREIELRMEQRQQMINFALVSLGGLLGLLGVLLRFGDLSKLFPPLLVFPIAIYFILFCIAYLRHDLFIAYNAQYLVNRVITSIRGRNASLPVDVLTWEEYVNSKRASKEGVKGFPGLIFHIGLGSARVLLMLFPGIAALAWGTWFFYPDLLRFPSAAAEGGTVFVTSFALFIVGYCALGFLVKTIREVFKAEGELSTAAKDQREKSWAATAKDNTQIATRLVAESTEAKDVSLKTTPSRPTHQGPGTEGDSKEPGVGS